MKKNRLIFIFLLIVSGIVLFVNHKRYYSFELQQLIAFDIRNNSFDRSFDFINSIDDNYPSLNIYAMPLKAIKANYLLAKDSVDLAMKYIDQSLKDNPYLFYGENLLADINYKLRDFEKFEYYARKAYNGLPNNPVHLVYMSRVYKMQDKIDSIFYIFEKSKPVVADRDFQLWNIALSSIVLDSALINKYDGKKIAKEALSFHPTNQNLKLMHDYIIYGYENVLNAKEKYEDGMSLFQQGEDDKGIRLLKEAAALHPNYQLYTDNLLIAYHNKSNFFEIANYYESYFKIFDETSYQILYFFGNALYKTGSLSSSCLILNSLNDQKFQFDKTFFPNCF